MNEKLHLARSATLCVHAGTHVDYYTGGVNSPVFTSVGISDTLMRVSVGIEDSEDLIEDFEQALDAG